MHPRPLPVPNFLKPVFRLFYEAHFGVIDLFRMIFNVFYRYPLFASRCASVGRNLKFDNMPFVAGPVEIHIGDDVWLGGMISILSGGPIEHPRLIIKDHAQINWNTYLVVNQEIVIEEFARVSYDCRISDSDGHRRESDLRAQDVPVDLRDIRPVRICRHAWIGNGAHIMKGVTIGEGAIIGANSVVISDIPPYSLAIGNPAEVYFRNYGRPSKASRQAAATDVPPVPEIVHKA